MMAGLLITQNGEVPRASGMIWACYCYILLTILCTAILRKKKIEINTKLLGHVQKSVKFRFTEEAGK